MSRADLGDDWTAERHLRKEHYCVAYIGNNADCGDPAEDVIDGEWLCDAHAAHRRSMAHWDAEREAFEAANPDWDVER